MPKNLLVTIKFSNHRFDYDTNSANNKDLLDVFFKEIPIVKKWTAEDQFLGTTRAQTHLDHLSLQLCTKNNDIVETELSRWSRYVISFDKLIEFDDLKITYDQESILISGTIKAKLGIKDIVYKDCINLKYRMNFKSISFRVKGTGDLLTFTKFGMNWESEKKITTEFSDGINDYFIEGLPDVHLEKYK